MPSIISGEITQTLDNKTDAAMLHCVNTLGVMGTGVALGVKLAYPHIYELYVSVTSEYTSQSLLGNYLAASTFSNGNYVYNIFGQTKIGRGKPQLNFEAFEAGVASSYGDFLKRGLQTFLAPWKVGCGNAGGDWDKVRPMIERIIPNVVWVDPGNLFLKRN